jgi:hypothetical protein
MDTSKNNDLWLSITSTLDSLDQVQQEFGLRGWLNFFWQDPEIKPTEGEVCRPQFCLIRIALTSKPFKIEHESKLPVMLGAIFENAREVYLFL